MEQAIADGHDVDKNLGGEPKRNVNFLGMNVQDSRSKCSYLFGVVTNVINTTCRSETCPSLLVYFGYYLQM